MGERRGRGPAPSRRLGSEKGLAPLLHPGVSGSVSGLSRPGAPLGLAPHGNKRSSNARRRTPDHRGPAGEGRWGLAPPPCAPGATEALDARKAGYHDGGFQAFSGRQRSERPSPVLYMNGPLARARALHARGPFPATEIQIPCQVFGGFRPDTEKWPKFR